MMRKLVIEIIVGVVCGVAVGLGVSHLFAQEARSRVAANHQRIEQQLQIKDLQNDVEELRMLNETLIELLQKCPDPGKL